MSQNVMAPLVKHFTEYDEKNSFHNKLKAMATDKDKNQLNISVSQKKYVQVVYAAEEAFGDLADREDFEPDGVCTQLF